MPLDSRIVFTLLVGAVVIERLVELVISARNSRAMRGRGGAEVGAAHYPWMVALHCGFLGSCVLEVWVLDRPLLPALAAASLVLLMTAMGLRYWVMAVLGDRWTTRVVCVPGEPLVTGGPFRWVRHPNYLAVVVEIIALPMVHTAWLTAVLFSLANAILLRVRIRVEETALERSTVYHEELGEVPRLVRGLR